MEELKALISTIIELTTEEETNFFTRCYVKKIKKKDFLGKSGEFCNNVYFIKSGAARLIATDKKGIEHTCYFVFENGFVSDYTSFISQVPAFYSVQAIENMEVVVLPREAFEWVYSNVAKSFKIGKLLVELQYILLDQRIKNMYTGSHIDFYQLMDDYFPNIHNRVPQSMIASYLGITPVHLSRLKKENRMNKR